MTSAFDIYCLHEATPGSEHTGYYIIAFDFVYVGNWDGKCISINFNYTYAVMIIFRVFLNTIINAVNIIPVFVSSQLTNDVGGVFLDWRPVSFHRQY